ncbi:hypothetical protein LTR62_006462 [Meristemomyces frigidus]|uniref:Xylanolytic transcriptional activator regulatory domain-containing protein n=1 Tax=Meristemomyces frigidus TaxID=1508187 RepID=A0AAN7YPU7_9PEZI|nr:hypothetical protein LTR62_006462 [Meristemomyces frigidus]
MQHAHRKLARLESLVTDLVASQSKAPPLVQDTNTAQYRAGGDVLTDTVGRLELTEDGATYAASSHWTSILQDIHEIKTELSEHGDSEGTTPSTWIPDHAHTSALPTVTLLNSAPSLALGDILSFVPSRTATDRLVSHFFNVFDMGPYMIQRARFLREYAAFWSEPAHVSIVWLGLLFSMLGTSLLMQRQSTETIDASPMSDDMLEVYRTMTIHCLSAGNYLQPSQYTIETLILHFALTQISSRDASNENWMLLGVIVRVAMRGGLHRDPSHWPKMNVCHAELRRRLWCMLYHLDFFTSTQVGLPRIIKDSQCDTQLPRHLVEADLAEDQHTMPAQRGLAETTPLLRLIERHGIVRANAAIYDATEARPLSITAKAALYQNLQMAIDALPPGARDTSIESLVGHDPMTLLTHISMDTLVHKATYLLHRGNLLTTASLERSDSEKQCIDAGLAILDHQRRLDEEMLPGGIFHSLRWKVATYLGSEFLQATMLLCLALRRFRVNGDHVLYRKDDINSSLMLARTIFMRHAHHWSEAQRAVAAITAVTDHAWDHTGVGASKGQSSGDTSFTPLVDNHNWTIDDLQLAAESDLDLPDFDPGIPLDATYLLDDTDLGVYTEDMLPNC